MKKRFVMSLTLAALSAGMLAACGSKTSAPAASSSAATAAASAPAAATTEAAAAVTEAPAAGTTEAAASSGDAMYDGKVLLGHASWIGFAPLNLADDMGFFEKHGVDCDIESFESKADSRAALAAGRIQGISTTVDTQVMSRAQGVNLQIVLAEDTSSGGDGISAIKDIKDFKDLKGHTVALDTSGGASYFWFNYLLQQNDMKMNDMKIQNMSSGDAGAAFVAGKVDAAITWEPWLSRAKEAPNGHILIDSSETPGIIVDCLAMDQDFASKYPGTVKGICEAWYDALDYIRTNPEDAYKILMKYTGDDTTDAVAGELSGVTLYDKEANEKYFGGEIQKVAKMASDLWLDNKLIDSAVSPDDVINGSFISGTD